MTSFIPPITKISPIVTRILGCNPGMMTLQGTNTYLLGSGRKRILFDAGEGIPEYMNHLTKVLTSENAYIEHIIISHWHIDHIGGVKDVILSSFAPNCRVWKYRSEDLYEFDEFENIPLHKLSDNQEFITDGVTLRVFHTPGHTKDHVILFLKEENAIFSADCILGEGSSVFEDLHDYMNSLRRIQNFNASIIYPGHGPLINNNTTKTVQKYIEHRLKREKDILSLLETFPEDKTWTAEELVENIYKETPENLHKAATLNVNQHLQKLLKDGRVILVDEKWKIKSNL